MLGTGSFAVLAIGSLLKAPSMHARKVGGGAVSCVGTTQGSQPAGNCGCARPLLSAHTCETQQLSSPRVCPFLLSGHAQIAATAFVVAWAVRLGGFLVVRVWKTGHDSRFDEAKHQPFKFWIYWTMQVWVQ